MIQGMKTQKEMCSKIKMLVKLKSLVEEVLMHHVGDMSLMERAVVVVTKGGDKLDQNKYHTTILYY